MPMRRSPTCSSNAARARRHDAAAARRAVCMRPSAGAARRPPRLRGTSGRIWVPVTFPSRSSVKARCLPRAPSSSTWGHGPAARRRRIRRRRQARAGHSKVPRMWMRGGGQRCVRARCERCPLMRWRFGSYPYDACATSSIHSWTPGSSGEITPPLRHRGGHRTANGRGPDGARPWRSALGQRARGILTTPASSRAATTPNPSPARRRHPCPCAPTYLG